MLPRHGEHDTTSTSVSREGTVRLLLNLKIKPNKIEYDLTAGELIISVSSVEAAPESE